MSEEINIKFYDPEVEELRKENQQLKEKYLNAVADYETTKSENQYLKERVEYLERSNNRREDTIISLRDELVTTESVLDEIRECVSEPWMVADYIIQQQINEKRLELLQILDKVKE